MSRIRFVSIASIVAALSLGVFGAGPALAASGGDCGDLIPVSRQADANSYNQITPYYVRVDGSFAFFEKNNAYFKPCAPVNIGDASSAWVSLIPDQSNPHYQDGVSIVQMGIINCNTTSYDACDNTVNVA